MEEEPDQLGVPLSTNGSTSTDEISQSSSSLEYAFAELKLLSECHSDSDEESYYNDILENGTAAEVLKNEAFAELLKRRRLELEALEAIDKVCLLTCYFLE